jgi:23S rRNA pseudouridine2605 synthase
MFEEIGHHVEKIKRVRYGPLSLDVPPGEFRRLTPAEIEKLKSAVGGRLAFQ